MFRLAGLVIVAAVFAYVGLRSTVVGLRIVDAWNAISPPSEHVQPRWSADYMRAVALLKNREPTNPLLGQLRQLFWLGGLALASGILLLWS